MESSRFSDRTGHLWVVVLAAHDDRRFRGAGAWPAELFVPTQFRRQHETRITPLQGALRRATALAPRQRIVAAVAEEHKQWWQHPLWFLPASNVLVQSKKLAPVYGLAAALLRIQERDPAARVLVLPSTHRVHDEQVLSQSMREAAQRTAERQSGVLLLLGVEPEANSAPHAAFLTGQRRGSNEFDIARLIDSPREVPETYGREHRLLWNTGIVAGAVGALLAGFERRLPDEVNEMRTVVRRNPRDRAILPVVGGYGGRSFDPTTAQVLLGSKLATRVLRVPLCGWSDLSAVGPAPGTRGSAGSRTFPPLLTGPMPASGSLLQLTHQADGV